jgi:RNA 2',3'-cyclic 3'-phosphodiesterase
MRTFVAIDIPPEIRDGIRELIATLRRAPSNVRWSRPEGLHITLKFLGEIPPDKVDSVKLTLQSLPAAEPIAVSITGAGFFPNERAPRVLWLGIEAGPELAQLAARVEDSLAPLGIAKEDRPFSPHLTLGRIRDNVGITSLRDLLKRQEPLQLGSFSATAFYLYESQLSSSGSIYKKMAQFPINSNAPNFG